MTLVDKPEKRLYDRSRREDGLLVAAREVFAELGFDAATTKAIADRAGCSESLIHRYFGGKDGLLSAVLQAGPARDPTAAELDQDLGADLRRAMHDELDQLAREGDFVRIAVARGLVDAGVRKAVAKRLETSRLERIVQRLGRHEQAGRIAEGHDLRASARVLVAMLLSAAVLSRHVFGHGRRRARGPLDHAVAAIAAALTRAPEPSSAGG